MTSLLTLGGAACSDETAMEAPAGTGGTSGAGTGGSAGGTSGTGGTSGMGAAPDLNGQATFDPGGPKQCTPSGAPAEALGDALELVAPQLTPVSFAATSAGLYLSARRSGDTPSALYHLPSDGAAPSPLVTTLGAPEYLMSNATQLVFWGVEEGTDFTELEAYYAIPLGSGATTPQKIIDEPADTAWRVAIDETNLYTHDETGGDLSAVPLAGGTPIVLGNYFNIYALVAQGGYVYFNARATSVFAGDGIVRLPAAGGPEEAVASGAGIIESFALADDAVYVADGDIGISRSAIGDTTGGELIYRYPSNVQTVGQVIGSMVTDGDTVFFSDSASNIGWVKADGSDCGLIIEAFVEAGGYERHFIALDADYLYVHKLIGGELYRIARSKLGL